MTVGRGGSARRRMRELATLETPDPRIGRAFDRARLRLLEEVHGDPGSAASAISVLATLSLGDAGPAATMLERWPESPGIDADPAGDDTFLLPILAARYLAWTGDSGLIGQIWSRVRLAHARAWELVRSGTATPGEIALVALLLREAAPLAEATGVGAVAAEVTAQARKLMQDLRVSSWPGRQDPFLPLAAALGGFDNDPSDALGRLQVQADGIRTLSDHALLSWAALSLGDAGSATAPWPALLLAQLEEENTWTDAELRGDRPIRAGVPAALVAGAVFGLVGAAPDAPKLRLRLRPVLPGLWSALTVRNLSMGDARFDLSVVRCGARREYRVDQTAGAYPARLILEIPVPGPAVRSIEVDGRPASLDIRPFGPGFLIPVQLVMDNERAVAVEGEGY